MAVLREDFRPFYGTHSCVKPGCGQAAEHMQVVRYSDEDKVERGREREVEHFCQTHKREEVAK